MVLSDRDIRREIKNGKLVIEPFLPRLVQPSSVDLRLGYVFRFSKQVKKPYIDIKVGGDDYTEEIKLKKGEPLIVHPSQFFLATTFERVGVPDYLVGQMFGKSSLGRLGIMIHSTAGYIDPGFKGLLVMEISNVGTIPIALYPEMRICQVSFSRLTSPAQYPYGSRKLGSKYQGQKTAVASKIAKEFSKK